MDLRAETKSKQTEENQNSKKNPSSHDDDEVNKPLLNSVPKTEIKQPKKKMPLFKKKPAAVEAAAGGGDSSMFGITLEQLNELMEVKGKDLMEKLNSSDYNGVKGILEKLKVDGNKGLEANNEQDLEQRRTAYGRNEIPPKPMKSFIRLCWDALHDMLLIILLVCSIVSICLSFYKPPQQEGDTQDEANLEWIEGVAILVAVLVVVFVTAFNDWRKERQFRGLQDKIEKDQQTSVVRDNRVQQIPVSELVVGDLCFIKYGDLLPADGLIVQASDLKIDESSITGETDLVKKSEKEDVGLLSGTNVMEGSGRMLVVGVGLNSQVGRIMSLLGATGDDSKKGKKKGKKKDKKKDKKDEKKKDKKKFKPKSSTKVSPDTSKPDENDDNTQTIHTENELKQHPRIRKLPPLQHANNDEQEMKPRKTENNEQQTKKSSSGEDKEKKKSSSSGSSNNETEKKSTKPPANDQQKEKKSSSSESSDDEQKKKKKKKKSSSDKSDNAETGKKSNETDEQKKKSTKPPTNDQQKEKKSSSSESSDDEQKKKKKSSSDKSDNAETEKQKKKSTKPPTNDEQKEKKSSSSESSDDEQKKKKKKSSSDKSDNAETEKQKKKSTKPPTNDQQKEKESSSSESSDDDDDEEKKKHGEELEKKKSSSSGGSNNEPEEQKKKKKSTKPPTNDEQKKKKSSSTENSEDKKKNKDVEELQNKKSSSSGSSNNEGEKKSTKPPTKDQPKEKKSSSSESSDDDEEKKKSGEELEKKKSSSSGGSNNKPEEQKKKKSTSNEEKDKKLTKTKSTDNQSDKSGSGDEEQEKKSEEKKQKQGNNRPATSSSIKAKVADGDKKKGDNDQNSKEDSDKKPAGLAALAENAEDDDEEGESKDSKHKSVLQEKLTRLALYIGYIGMAAAGLTLICLIIRFAISTYVIKKQAAQASDVSYYIAFLIQAITVVVVSVPEGLPLAVTLALAYAVRKMMTDNNLVRHLDACETMGNASTICSDKTGTLTTNRMTVVQCYITGKHHDKLPKGEEINKDVLPLLFEAVTVNANYTSKIEEAKKEEGGLPKQVGNKTECALLDLVRKWGGSYDEIREQIPQEKLVKVYTFNSARKMMSTVIEREEGYRVYTKGASEMVLALCKSILGEDNKPKDLNDDEKKKITHDFIEKMANDGLRTICIGYRDLGKEAQNWDDDEDKVVKDLICIALVGIEDPVRDEVPEAIEKCQKAGVVVRMVTGDNIMTARSIATKCGIIKPEDDFLVLEGKEFNKRIRDSSGKISQKKLDEVWPKLRVLARSSPTDKYNLVNGIVESRVTQHREVVAVTGDGTNDGPALKRADVGFAMGIQGTDVAKQASDIILTDDNFSSIVKAMMWGRNVYDCIAKFLQFQLTANLSAGVISVVSAAAISSVPLRAVQMLWVNLVMDTLASLALATEPPTEELLNRKPYGRTKSIISPLMMRNILGQSLYQLVVMFIILYVGQSFLDFDSTVQQIQNDPQSGREISTQFTMVFNAFVLMTLFNEINSRKLHGERNVFKGIFRNPFFYCILIGCFCAQILIVTFGDQVFSCARLSIKQWAWSLLFGVGSLIWQQILIFIPVKPFSTCFSAVYRFCCPCIYKKQKKKQEEEEKGEKDDDEKKKKTKRSSKKKDDGDEEESDEEEDDATNAAFRKYSTIVQLTNATVVTQPPPIFARYMLRKSVDRLNTEFRVISEFRSRLDKVKHTQYGETAGYQRASRADILEE